MFHVFFFAKTQSNFVGFYTKKNTNKIIKLKFKKKNDRKFLRGIRQLGETMEMSQQTFWGRALVLITDDYHVLFSNKSLGTFARERTSALNDIRDLFTRVAGTQFSRKKKKNNVFLWNTNPKKMILKDGMDCRRNITIHVVKNCLQSYARKEIYFIWLLKRNIPVPEEMTQKVLEV